MHALSSSLVWLCTLIVALPLTPCAFFNSARCRHEPAAEAATLAEAARPCCTQQSAPAKRPAEENDRPPCQSECCRLSPFVPLAEKVPFDAQPLAVASALPQIVAQPGRPLVFPSAELAEAPALQILHCQWRL
jgi:hypothetical protein